MKRELRIAKRKCLTRCLRALAAYTSSDEAINLVDFLADAMHWCDSAGENFHWAMAQACRHYVHELNDQQQDERRLNL
jgi:hypothetical protein